MSDLQALIKQRDDILVQIKAIEENSEVKINKILEAIKKQRWYFFKNDPKILMDRDTGYLWVNLDYFPWNPNKDRTYDHYTFDEAVSILKNYKTNVVKEWQIPKLDDFKEMIEDRSFPFYEASGCNEDLDHSIQKCMNWFCISDDKIFDESICLWNLKPGRATSIFGSNDYDYSMCLLPYSTQLVDGTNYKQDVSKKNRVYKEKEKLRFTLDLFVNNNLIPIFDDEKITELYRNFYIEKPQLIKKLEPLSKQIEELSKVTLLSSEFDYLTLLAKYDIKAIESSPIKYFRAVQQWIDGLIDQLENYEEKMGNTIREFNSINLNLSKKHEDSSYLTDDENELLSSRQKYFKKLFSVEMVSVKNKLLAIKKQADDLEDKIDRINDGDNALYELALLEKEERVSFSFLAENTAMILKNALVKVEYFQKNYDFVKTSIEIWESWNEDYKVFKTTYKEEMKKFCEDDSIENELWSKWYEDWRKLRFAIETKLQPIIERGLKSMIPVSQQVKDSVPLLLIQALETYKNAIDKFYLEERKGIYQKFAFQAGGDLQDKFETESELYKRTAAFQSQLQDIIFNCSNTEDRIFIFRWANDLLDIQIDEILTFVVDKDLQQISRTLLQEFSLLKQKNYSIYLMDVKAYSEEKSRREKEYNSLIFKMRKDLMK